MRRRIIICLTLLLALCLFGGAIAIYTLDRSLRRLNGLARAHDIQLRRNTLYTDGMHLQADLLASVADPVADPEPRLDNLDGFEAELHACGGCHEDHDATVQAELDGLEASFVAYRDVAERLFATPFETEVPPLGREAAELANILVRKTAAVSDRAMEHLADDTSEAAAIINRAELVLLTTLLTALLFGGAIAFHLERHLTMPVTALLAGIDRVRRGQKPHRFPISGDEEFRRVGEAFDQAYSGLKAAQDGILQAEKMASVGKLAAGVAHEVGNPLASISSVAQVMRRHCNSDELKEQIDLIMKQIDRITRIVRHLLAFSRPPGAEQRGRVDLKALIEQATTLLSYDERSRRVSVVSTFDPRLHDIPGDADRLLLVFTNVMINAFDAICDGRKDAAGRVAITCAHNTSHTVVRIEDDGPGMSEEQIANAFEPFFTTKEPGKGTGLGLWICYHAVRRHHGDIRIESRLGRGTTVTIELPSEDPEAGATPGDSVGGEPAQTPLPNDTTTTASAPQK